MTTGPARLALMALALALAACTAEPPPAANDSEANAAEAAEAAEPASLPSCPFRSTGGWAGSVEGGRLLVTGTVDLQMAGFRPTLTPREGAGTAFDLALVPEAQAAVTDRVRYEGAPLGGAAGEIWCGGEKIADFDIVRID
jgi:hypothetical protein